MTAQQGTCDYLCGLYSLVNDLSAYCVAGSEGSNRTAFTLLIRSAEELGYLDAQHLLHGYEAYELVEIYNRTAENHRIPRRAVHLADFVDGDCTKVTSKEVAEAFRRRGSIIWYASDENHWVLVKDKGRKVIDSLREGEPRSVAAVDIENPEICIAILPFDKVPS